TLTFFFSSRRRHTRFSRDWSSDVCSSDLVSDARASIDPLPSGWRVWIAGARPRTLPAALVPVLVGTACAAGRTDLVAWRFVAARSEERRVGMSAEHSLDGKPLRTALATST